MFRLAPRSGRVHTGFHESRATRDAPSAAAGPTGTGPSPSAARHPSLFPSTNGFSQPPAAPATGQALPRHRTRSPRRVNARARFSLDPLSLATTHGMSFPAGTEMFHFPAFPPRQARCHGTARGGLPHSETLGSKPTRRLPQDYRGPSRPSSALHAKASTNRPPTGITPAGQHNQATLDNMSTRKNAIKTIQKKIRKNNRLQTEPAKQYSMTRDPEGPRHARVHSPVLKPPRATRAARPAHGTGHGRTAPRPGGQGTRKRRPRHSATTAK